MYDKPFPVEICKKIELPERAMFFIERGVKWPKKGGSRLNYGI